MSNSFSFKARSHILSLLGDELIGSDNLAIFELVKNAYDADATEVKVIFQNLNKSDHTIIIEDNGHGMTLDKLKNVWLEIGTDFKRGNKRTPTPKYKRPTLGEKGVGRLAVHKLATNIRLETKTSDDLFSYSISINWKDLIKSAEYIEGTKVFIETHSENLFEEYNHGTRIILTNLRKKQWIRGDLRRLARTINNLKSPFRKVDNFDVTLSVPEEFNDWIKDITGAEEILEHAIYQFDFKIDDKAEYSWKYNFNPPPGFPIKKNKDGNDNDKLILEKKSAKILKKENLENIGSLSGKFYIFNLDAYVLNAFNQQSSIKSYLKENAGVRVFRDGIRVYNYGEPGNDWLGLDLERVQKLGERFSNNTIISAIELELDKSIDGLKEKTNREGFDENEYFETFRDICLSVMAHITNISRGDRELIRSYIENEKPIKKIGFSESINELKEKIHEKKIEKELSPYIKRVEKDYQQMRDVMLNSGISGMNLSIVFHEVEREVGNINAEISRKADINKIKDRIKNLVNLLDGFSPILKQNKSKHISAKYIVERAVNIHISRFKYHKIVHSCPLITGEAKDFQIFGPANLLVSAISNIIDNAIYWVTLRREKENNDFKPRIYISTNETDFGTPSIVIADNGDGIHLPVEDITAPFKTTRPGGMGLGLYYTSLVMEMIGGELIIPDASDVELPKGITGAVMVLKFKKDKNV